MPLILSGDTGISGVDGTAGTPSLQGTDSNTGVFYATDIVGIATGGSERMRIDSSGNVGIGTNSPASRLDVNGTIRASAASCSIAVIPSTTTNQADFFTQNAGGTFYIGLNNSTGTYFGGTAYSANLYVNNALPIVFSTTATERMRITSAGDVLVGATSNVFNSKLGVTTSGQFPFASITSDVVGSIFSKSSSGAGNQIFFLSGNNFNYGVIGVNAADGTSAGDQFQLGYVASASGTATSVLRWGRAATCIGLSTAPSTSGTGITFPATQSASSDANTLDDYEEGTWTPVVAFGGGTTGNSYARQSGKYTKVGNLVTVAIDIAMTKGSSTGAITVTLPFTISSVSYTAAQFYISGMTSALVGVSALLINGNSTIALVYSNGGNDADITSSLVSAGQVNYQGSFSYFV